MFGKKKKAPPFVTAIIPAAECKEIEESNRMGKTRDLLKNIIENLKHFMQIRA